jgi:hypothetical protein
MKILIPAILVLACHIRVQSSVLDSAPLLPFSVDGTYINLAGKSSIFQKECQKFRELIERVQSAQLAFPHNDRLFQSSCDTIENAGKFLEGLLGVVYSPHSKNYPLYKVIIDRLGALRSEYGAMLSVAWQERELRVHGAPEIVPRRSGHGFTNILSRVAGLAQNFCVFITKPATFMPKRYFLTTERNRAVQSLIVKHQLCHVDMLLSVCDVFGGAGRMGKEVEDAGKFLEGLLRMVYSPHSKNYKVLAGTVG